MGAGLEELVEYHVRMVAQPWLQDTDLVLWTLLLAEDLNAAALARLQAAHPDIRYAHGFLFQQLVDGPGPVGRRPGAAGGPAERLAGRWRPDALKPPPAGADDLVTWLSISITRCATSSRPRARTST